MFSATFPRQMEALARKILTKPIEVIKRADKALFCWEFVDLLSQCCVIVKIRFFWTSGFILLFQIQVGGRSVVCSDVQQNVVCTVEPLLSGHPLLCSQLLKSRTYCQYNTVTVLLIIISFLYHCSESRLQQTGQREVTILFWHQISPTFYSMQIYVHFWSSSSNVIEPDSRKKDYRLKMFQSHSSMMFIHSTFLGCHWRGRKVFEVTWVAWYLPRGR